MGEGWERVALGTENDRFKSKYQQYLSVALLISLVVWINVFLFTPELEIEPYRLKEETIEVIDIPDVVDIPPPPQELPKPQAGFPRRSTMPSSGCHRVPTLRRSRRLTAS